MDIETIKVNLLNVTALTMTMMPIERVVAVAVGITAIIYNVLKIIGWFTKERKGLTNQDKT